MNGEPTEAKRAKKSHKTVKAPEELRCKALYRELRVSTFCLLNYPLKIFPSNPIEEEEEESKDKAQLSPSCLVYLLEDLLVKLQLCLVSKKGFGGQGRKPIPRYLARYTPITLINAISPYLAPLRAKLDMIVDGLSSGEEMGGIAPATRSELVRGLTLILSILKTLCSSLASSVVNNLLSKFLSIGERQDVYGSFFALLQNVIPHASCDTKTAVLVLQLMEQTVQLGITPTPPATHYCHSPRLLL